MILKNESETFKVKFAGKVLTIPSGEFEVADICARHILKKTKAKEFKVSIVKIKEQPIIKSIDSITTIEDKEQKEKQEKANAELEAEIKAENEANAKAEKEAKELAEKEAKAKLATKSKTKKTNK